MRNEKNICQYCTRQGVITTLSLNACWNQLYQELSYLLKKLQVLILPGYILYFLTVLYFHISIRIFSALFVCLVFDGFLQLICFRMFCSKRSTTLENTYLPSCWFYCVGALYIEFGWISVNSNVLYIPLSYLTFHIPLIFAWLYICT